MVPNMPFTFILELFLPGGKRISSVLLTSSKSKSMLINTYTEIILLLRGQSKDSTVGVAFMVVVAELVETEWNGNKNGKERMAPTWL